MDKNEMLEFEVVITYERYYNEETSFGVFGFSTEDDIPYFITSANDTNDQKKYSCLSGKMQHLSVGGRYAVKANYIKNVKYGDQYSPISVYALMPKTQDEQLEFLQVIIPPTVAQNLINAYPNIVEDIVVNKLDTIDFSKVKGVQQFTWERIKQKVLNNYLISDIIVLLKPLGITYNMIQKLLKDEQNPVLLKQKIKNNPYTLTKIKGLGFQKVDDLCLKMKPQMINSFERLFAFVKYYLEGLGENDGHTWIDIQELKKTVTNFVPESIEYFDTLLENEQFFYVDQNRIGLKYYYNVEKSVVDIINEKIQDSLSYEIEDNIVEQAIHLAEKEQGFLYTPEQIEVIKTCSYQNVCFLSGKAGTGKTSIMRGLIKAYQLSKKNIIACALSAMAAQRLIEATGYPASTIHRTLGCQGENIFTFNKNFPLQTDLVVLDESSMVNADLFLKLIEAIGQKTRIIICGDYKQLPPIGFGNIFSDLIENVDKIYVHVLTKIMRQATLSGISMDANMIRDNVNPIHDFTKDKIVHGTNKDMFYLFRDDREKIFNIALRTYISWANKVGVDNVVIAVPRKQNCTNSTYNINKTLLNYYFKDEPKEIEGVNYNFKLGAKVMQTVNDYDRNVFNGEIGYITNIGTEINDKNKTVEFCEVTYKVYSNEQDQNKVIKYYKKDLINLDLAYAMTVHKLQGAGKQYVIGIIDNTHYKLLDNCMLYTMITRAKKRCLLIAEKQAYVQCIRTSHNRRNTWIKDIIRSNN